MNLYAVQSGEVVITHSQLASLEKKYVFKIKDMPTEDKPREKLLKYGPATLTIHELLALILNVGTKREDVLTMASRVLKEYGERALMNQTSATHIAQDLNIPLVKAMQIVACGEIGRRFFQRNESGLAVLRTARDVYEYVADMRHLSKEHLRGIYLNSHYRVIHDEFISIGTNSASLIHPREVFKPAIEYGASGVIVAHNHPSHTVEPSEADLEVTRQLVAAGRIIGISLIDHVIVSKESFKSIDVDYT